MFAMEALEQDPSSLPSKEASRFSRLLYTSRWHFVSDAKRIVSVLGGMDLSTSALSLLKTKGLNNLCNWEIIVFLASSSSTSRSNHSSNWSDDAKTSGSKKLSKAQSSCKLFCNGVPVTSK